MKEIIKHTTDNATPIVIDALSRLRAAGGGELHLEAGEYHFYKEGSRREFFAVSNNSACDKYIVFPVIGMRDLVIDGHGATLVFHDVTFPFMISESKNITLRNLFCDTGVSPLVEFVVHDITDQGFCMDLKDPYFVEDGSLMFRRESEIVSGKEEFFSLHALGRHAVQFFATGDCRADMSNLPARLMKCDVEKTETGIRATYRADCPDPIRYSEGETITAIIDGKRNVDVICLNRSENITLEQITVARGIGMGIVGQLTTNISVDGFSTDIGYHQGAHQTLTADSLHFVNCDGKLEVKNCTISDTMDDIINVHGMYTSVTGVEETVLHSAIMHQEQRFFNPYRAGDRLVLINNETFDIVAEFVVEASELISGTEIITRGQFTYGREAVQAGFWIENPDRMPDVHLHHNRFYNFPNIRLSGGGEILVEDNHITRGSSALLCFDLARYWYESGRVKHLVYRNNRLESCSGRAVLRIGIDGVGDEVAPKIHERIEITGNTFSDVSRHAVVAGGVKELVIENNTFDTEREDLILVDQPR